MNYNTIYSSKIIKYIKLNKYNIILLCLIILLLIICFLYKNSEYFNNNNNKNDDNNGNVNNIINTNISSQSKNLIFTSAGDNTQFYNHWLGENRNYDVWCVYYGNNDENYKKYTTLVDKIWKRKGSKFQNFHYIYKNYRELLNKYDRFFIVDDDIVINTNDINNLFDISIKYDLWLCQPSYTSTSKISWPGTKHVPNNLLRYTNFTENGTTVFSKYAIHKFMEYYDPILIGWGIDLFYIWVLGEDVKDKYAIIDSIQCINPHDGEKVVKTRELNNIKNYKSEANYWHKIKTKYNISDLTFKTYSTIKL